MRYRVSQAMKEWQHSFIAFFIGCTLCMIPAVVSANAPVSLRIQPENVGVLYQSKTQQFKAIAVFSDGTEKDYTHLVGWSIEPNPLEEQSHSPQQVASINDRGLATVKNTWGRLNVVATFPKPPTVKLPGVYDLLLKQEPGIQPHEFLFSINYLLLKE